MIKIRRMSNTVIYFNKEEDFQEIYGPHNQLIAISILILILATIMVPIMIPIMTTIEDED